MHEWKLEDQRRRLALLRKAFGLTVAGMTAQLGVKDKRLYNYENSPISRQMAFLLYKRFGVTPDWIWFGLVGDLSPAIARKLKAAERAEKQDKTATQAAVELAKKLSLTRKELAKLLLK
jgi:plasmid maintenance system antidote protein VapI